MAMLPVVVGSLWKHNAWPIQVIYIPVVKIARRRPEKHCTHFMTVHPKHSFI